MSAAWSKSRIEAADGTPLTAPISPATIATERPRIHDALYVETVITELTADYWQAAGCHVCGAVGQAPCRDGGRFVRRHGGRS